MPTVIIVYGARSTPLAYPLVLSLSHGGSYSVWQLRAESIAAARRLRRQRNLDQIEIPEDQVVISEDVLGKGGFGTVYLADYNGRNAAAKVRVP